MINPKPNTLIIIFSKNRTLQLKSLLKSIRYYSDINDNDINIIYTTVPEITYEHLLSEFDCNFIVQKNFLKDVNSLIETSSCKYVLFMVDDLIFRDSFSLRRVEELLGQHQNIDCFSLRLGRNIENDLPPKFESFEDDILFWDTKPGLGLMWRYFWEVSSSIYRKELVLKYISLCDPRKVNFPNPFESTYYYWIPSDIGGNFLKRFKRGLRLIGKRKPKRMACFEISKCFTQGVNMVAERNIKYNTLYKPLELHKKMLQGYIIDYLSLQDSLNNYPNMGETLFSLMKEKT